MENPMKPVIGENDLIIDAVSGFAINVPAEEQKPYQWWLTYPQHYKDIVAMRKILGLEIVDNLDPDKALQDLFGEGE